MAKATKKKAASKPRADKYVEKFKIEGSFEDTIKKLVSVDPIKAKKK